jgi:hypothetical protein
METMQFEPMSVGRIFDRAFAIYRNNFLRFITIVAIIEVPLALLSTAYNSWTTTSAPSRHPSASRQTTVSQDTGSAARRYNPAEERPILTCCLAFTFTFLVQIVAGMLCQAALIKSVSETYLGNDITVGQAYGFILPKFLTLVGATLCVMLVVGLGIMLVFVPGIIFGLWFSMTVPTIVVEGQAATHAMSRSKALVAGNLGKIIAVGILGSLIAYIIILPLRYLGGFVGQSLFADNTMLVSFLRQFGMTLGQILAIPISTAASILLYYDLRIRKEGFDLQMLAQSMTAGQGEPRAA